MFRVQGLECAVWARVLSSGYGVGAYEFRVYTKPLIILKAIFLLNKLSV